ncbi:MAG: hypothetical protein Q7R79_03095 [bacterium]|nr:hypothetical protein [bacterium]
MGTKQKPLEEETQIPKGNKVDLFIQSLFVSNNPLVVFNRTALHDLEYDRKAIHELGQALKAGAERWYFVPVDDWYSYGRDIVERLEPYVGSESALKKRFRIYGVATNFPFRLQLQLYLSNDSKGADGALSIADRMYLLPKHIAGAILFYLKDIAKEIERKSTPENKNELVIESFHRFF